MRPEDERWATGFSSALWRRCPASSGWRSVLNALRRVLTLSMSFDSSELVARAPDPTVLAEQRFGNVVGEMAIAAALPPPRVFIVDSPIVDAVAFGTDERHSTIVISQGLARPVESRADGGRGGQPGGGDCRR